MVLPCGIHDKGAVLNRLSAFWFQRTESIIANHLIEVVGDARCLDNYLPAASRFAYPCYLEERSMIVKKAKLIPVECVVRGYLSGSAWAEYQKQGTVNGEPLPEGLKETMPSKRRITTVLFATTPAHCWLPVRRWVWPRFTVC